MSVIPGVVSPSLCMAQMLFSSSRSEINESISIRSQCVGSEQGLKHEEIGKGDAHVASHL